MRDTIYIGTTDIGCTNSSYNISFPVNLSKDKTVFHYLRKKLGHDSLEFRPPFDSLCFLGGPDIREIKKGAKAGVIFTLSVLHKESADGHYHRFKPEIKYALGGKVEKGVIGKDRIILNTDISTFLNNHADVECIIVKGYRRNEKGGYTGSPEESEVSLEYLFSNGALSLVDASRGGGNGTEEVIVLRDYRNMFKELFNDHKGILSPYNLFRGERDRWNKKWKRDERFGGLIPSTKIDGIIVIDEIIDQLYPMLFLKHEEAVRQTLKHE